MEKILNEFQTNQKELIHILHRIHDEFGYIPPEAVAKVSRHLKVSESEIFSVLTFYKAFSLEPRGKHIVTVCIGTACHVRGAPQLTDELARKLDIKVGQTTPDKEFTLETVNCLGCCAIGPVVVVNGEYYSYITQQKIDSILEKYGKSE